MTAAMNRSETDVRERILRRRETAISRNRYQKITIADDHVRLSCRGRYRSLRSSVLSVDAASSRILTLQMIPADYRHRGQLPRRAS
jgi:hypothetical protein